MKNLLIELQKRNLPDIFFNFESGKRATTVEEWQKIMRPFWLNLLLKEEYGKLPPVVEPKITLKNNVIHFAGKAVWEEVTFHFEYKGKTHSVPTQLIYPKHKQNIPFVVSLNFNPEFPNKYCPVEEIIDQGLGIFGVCYNDITMDDTDFTNGLAGLFTEQERVGDATGKIVYWAYMAERMMDYLLTRSEPNKALIGVAGHSRLGKTALLAGAMDERFAFVLCNDSGCSGAALSKGRAPGGETIRDGYTLFPAWYCPNYASYMDNHEGLPFDQHCLAALVAPRLLIIGAALEDVWADNDSQFLTALAASPAWELYGVNGFIAEDRLPQVGDNFTKGKVGFFLRKGAHFFSRDDWNIYIKALKEHFNL